MSPPQPTGADEVAARRACPLCAVATFTPFADLGRMPVHVGVLWRDAASARDCARGLVVLSFCSTCGFIGNSAFDPDLVAYADEEYDNALHGSAVFRAFEHDLVERLATRYPIAGGDVVEIGCGDGRFLGLLCARAGARGLGFEPSFDPTRPGFPAGVDVEVRREEFAPGKLARPPVLVCCRQVLEHVADPHVLVRAAHAALAPGGPTYFEVPNALMPLRDLSIWDVVYEHCAYYAVEPLHRLFGAVGFDVAELAECYAGQFLGVEARRGDSAPKDPREGDADAVAELGRLVDAFADSWRQRQDAWSARLAAIRSDGRRAVVWGGGARAVGLFNAVGIEDEVPYLVDVNPAKQGTFLGGTGHPIVEPERLREYRPDLVVVVNPIYAEEIGEALHGLGLDPELVPA